MGYVISLVLSAVALTAYAYETPAFQRGPTFVGVLLMLLFFISACGFISRIVEGL